MFRNDSIYTPKIEPLTLKEAQGVAAELSKKWVGKHAIKLIEAEQFYEGFSPIIVVYVEGSEAQLSKVGEMFGGHHNHMTEVIVRPYYQSQQHHYDSKIRDIIAAELERLKSYHKNTKGMKRPIPAHPKTLSDALVVFDFQKVPDKESLRRRYKQMSFKYHPDRLSDKSDEAKKHGEKMFKAVSAAKQILDKYMK